MRCAHCQGLMTATRSTKRWCSPACSQAAYRKRQARKQRRHLVPATRTNAQTDMVLTPPALARQIVSFFRPSGLALDPCRGPMRPFYSALQRHGCTVDWCEITEGKDFLEYDRQVNWIITNPPWSRFLAFLKHAMTLADDVVFLAALSAFTGFRARLDAMKDAGFGLRESLLVPHPPKPWPVSGFQLAATRISRGYRGPFVMHQG
jgi:hypothetical protein